MPVIQTLSKVAQAVVEPDPAKVLDALIEVSGAERGFLVLREGSELVVHTARNMDREEVLRARDKVSRTLLERVLAGGRAVAASDADISGTDSLRRRNVRSVCALPLRSLAGAIYLDHRFESGLFGRLGELEEWAAGMDAALHREREIAELRARAEPGGFVGSSKPMQEVRRLIARAAAAPYPVLIQGESGTGKELAARALHVQSPRAAQPFVAANCATFPDHLVDAEFFGHAKGAFTGADRDRAGLFELADGGTLFLDEIACLSAEGQESLLRVIETGEIRRVGGMRTDRVDVRVVAAASERLGGSTTFRRDLFYRLDVIRIDLPPLRDRKEDIPALVDHFLDRIARETGSPRKRLSRPAMGAILEHRWPGNVRELENSLRRAAALADDGVLDRGAFAFLEQRSAESADAPPVTLDEYIRHAISRWGDRMEAQELADRLGISRKTLWEKRKQFGL